MLKLRHDPAMFIAVALGGRLHPIQYDICEAIKSSPRVSVVGCNASGKDWLSARLAWWYLTCFPNAKVLCLSNTHSQVNDVMFSNIRAAYDNAPYQDLLPAEPLPKGLRVDAGSERFIVGRSPDSPAGIQGYHGGNIMVIISEAQFFDPEIYDAILTLAPSKLVLLGNASEGTEGGFFYASHNENAHNWNAIRIAFDDLPTAHTQDPDDDAGYPGMTTQNMVKTWAAEWGSKSRRYASAVHASWDAEGASMALFTRPAIRAAVERVNPSDDDVIVGLDVARYGADSTVGYVRRGNQAREIMRVQGRGTMEVTGLITRLCAQGVDRLVVDGVGIGSGVYDRLQELYDERELNVGELEFFGAGNSPTDNQYGNIGTQCWFEMSEWMQDADIDDNPVLALDLISRIYEVASNGRYRLDSKKDNRGRGSVGHSDLTKAQGNLFAERGASYFFNNLLDAADWGKAHPIADASPDAADALAMTFAPPPDKRRFW